MKLDRFITSLKTQPGVWQQYQPVKGQTPAQAAQLRNRHPGLEMRCQVRPDHRYDVFLRWAP